MAADTTIANLVAKISVVDDATAALQKVSKAAANTQDALDHVSGNKATIAFDKTATGAVGLVEPLQQVAEALAVTQEAMNTLATALSSTDEYLHAANESFDETSHYMDDLGNSADSLSSKLEGVHNALGKIGRAFSFVRSAFAMGLAGFGLANFASAGARRYDTSTVTGESVRDVKSLEELYEREGGSDAEARAVMNEFANSARVGRMEGFQKGDRFHEMGARLGIGGPHEYKSYFDFMQAAGAKASKMAGGDKRLARDFLFGQQGMGFTNIEYQLFGTAEARSNTAQHRANQKYDEESAKSAKKMEQAIKDMSKAFDPVLAKALELATPLIKSLAKGLTALGDWAINNKEVVVPLIAGLGLAALAASGPIGMLAAAVAGLALAWGNWDKIKEKWNDFTDALYARFPMLEKVQQKLSELLGDLLNWAIEKAKGNTEDLAKSGMDINDVFGGGLFVGGSDVAANQLGVGSEETQKRLAAIKAKREARKSAAVAAAENKGGVLDKVIPSAQAATLPTSQKSSNDANFSAEGDRWELLKAAISSVESGKYGYNAVNKPGSYKSGTMDLTNMTIGEVFELQKQGKILAAGKYQFTSNNPKKGLSFDPNGTLPSMVRKAGLSLDTKFDAQTQDLLARTLAMQHPAVRRWLAGGPMTKEAQHYLAGQWRGLPDWHGGTYADRYSASNRARHTPEIARIFGQRNAQGIYTYAGLGGSTAYVNNNNSKNTYNINVNVADGSGLQKGVTDTVAALKSMATPRQVGRAAASGVAG